MKNNKKISKSFISFLIASVLIWLLITLSKEYTTTLTLPVKYTNISQDKLLQKEPTKEIDILVKSTGFNIIRSRFGNKSLALSAHKLIRKSSSKYYFLTKNQFIAIQKQLRSGVQLQDIALDTIYLEIGSLISKKVALKPNLEIKYHIGYDILETVLIKPDSILISGPEAQIENIKTINLELLKLEDVKSSFSEKVKIILPENSSNIKVNSSFTTVSGKVEKFTEGSFQIPFIVDNLPEGVELTTLNKTVEVVFVVGLSNFDKIDKNFFKVVCDYNISKENNLSYLLPKVTSNSSLIKSFKLIPNKIDFLIQK
ncbi:CdaR family protein [Polaribacter sp. SA4-12]|uniref:CdaR family protein n=1 Tax=Polaribacter sp. SA4-12 TaxID=1312072 RepID=UPI000B3D399D|nr:YbbR-like domain-containing protein [Polaribacter sp. SA4-12]ARV14457.1 hypothetical protein BTO07_04525 [Polaribacter sp. SA4-12]